MISPFMPSQTAHHTCRGILSGWNSTRMDTLCMTRRDARRISGGGGVSYWNSVT